jgi:steroid 5-alpha reductase family enzyme
MFNFKRANKKNKSKANDNRTIVIKGWPEVLIFLFMAIFILQLVLLIILNSRSN